MFDKYKNDIGFLSIITICFLVVLFFINTYLINIFIDFGREVYFPELMIKGKLLYKDLFNIFGPLGYQINELLYRFLGINVSTLKIAGCFCSILILYFTYFISRNFFKAKLAFSLTLLVLTTSVFSPSVFNFIYPYSYSILYSYTAFLGAVLLFLVSLKNDSQKYFLLCSYFLMGISIAAKYEYIGFVFVLLIYSIFVFKQKCIDLFVNIAALFFVPVISYGYLFYQGVTLSDFVKNFHYLKNYVTSESLHYFYSHSVGTFFSFDLFNKININDLCFALIFVVLYFIISFTVIKYQKYFSKYIKSEYIIFLIGFLISFKWLYPRQLYFYIPYFIYGIFICYLIKSFKSKTFNAKDLYFVLLVVSLISILKTAFILDVKIYGTYYFALPMVLIMYSIKDIIFNRNIFKSIDIVSTFIFILVAVTLYHTSTDFSARTSLIQTEKSNFYMHPIAAKSVEELLIYIDENTSENQSLFVLPEGSFINYITNKDMKLYNYYSLMPPYIETFGVEKIVKDFRNAKIDYIVITPRFMDEYNIDESFCENPYAKAKNNAQSNVNTFCSYIRENYQLVKSIGDIYSFRIYKFNQ